MKTKLLLVIVFAVGFAGTTLSQAPNSWTQKSDFGGTIRERGVGFSIGTKAYIGTGWDSNTNAKTNDFWEYDPATNVWTQKANFAGGVRQEAVGFSIGNRGYVGTGMDNGIVNYGLKKDFWEYNPATNSWMQKADFTGTARVGATGFSIGAMGYIGTGNDGPNSRRNDFWEYNPATNAWTQKANFGGVGRDYAVGFSIGNKGYLGTGDQGGSNVNDFWEYDPATNAWIQKANFAGTSRGSAVGFSIGNKGYIGTGNNILSGNTQYNDFWEWNQATNIWTQKAAFSGVIRSMAVGFSIDNKGYIGTGVNKTTGDKKDFWEYTPSLNIITNAWTQKSDFGGTVRERGVGFSIGTKAYIGTGYDGNANAKTNDFWEYDPITNVWTQKANFAGGVRQEAVGFAIGNKGYLGTGMDNGTVNYLKNDFWEYDPAANTWTQKANFAGTARLGAVGFSIGTKGFIGTGIDGPNNRRQDFWEYNPATNAWTQKANFGGVGRDYAVGFSIGNKGYLGTGDQGGSNVNDFWEYDPAANAWIQKAAFAGTSRGSAVGFSIGNKGYIGTGNNILSGNTQYNDFWEWNQATNIWTQKSAFSGVIRSMAVGFSIGNKGYIGTGVNKVTGDKKDFWEYAPDSFLFLGNDTLKVTAAQVIRTVAVTSNLYWTVSNPVSWVTINPMAGIGVGSLTVSIQKNISASSRQTNITVTTGNITRNINVFQAGLVVNKWLGADQQELDINNVRAAVTSLNTTFRDIHMNTGAYHVPKTDSARSTTFTSTIWIGGISNNNIYMAAETYRQSGFDFHHGPVSNQYFPAVPNTWAKVWKISKKEIDDFRATGKDSMNMITTWPGNGSVSNGQAHYLTMFHDLNNNGIYEPALREFPLIKGDQSLFAVFNDDTIHTEETDNPGRMKIEVQRYNYAFNGLSPTLNNTTFADYKLINRTNRTYDTLVFTAYMDYDIGNYADDYIGTDTTRKMIYAYNGNVFDSTSAGYGVNPPAQACVFLNRSLDASMFYNNGSTSVTGNPLTSSDYLNYMSGTWKDSKSLTYGSDGYNGTQKTKYAFPGNPCNNTGWWEGGVPNAPNDRRILGTTIFYNVGPYEEVEVKLAYVFARGNNGNISSVCDLKSAADSVIAFYNANPNKFPSNILSVNTENLNYTNTNGSKPIRLVCNTNWVATANQSWVALNKTSGNGNDSIHVAVTSNSAHTPRTATITFTAGPLTQIVNIFQDSTPVPPDSLSLNKDSIFSVFSGDTTTILVTSNRNWTVSSNQSWVAVNSNSGNGNGSFTVITSNNTGADRNAIVSVAAGSVNKSVYVIQNQNSIGINDLINNDKKITIYPNPSSGLFTIDFNKLNGNKIVKVYDVTGKLIKEVETAYKELEINLEGFYHGVCLVKVYAGGETYSRKIVVNSN